MSTKSTQTTSPSRKVTMDQNRLAPAVAAGPVSVTPENIRARAFELYQARNGSGTAGDPESDWLRAERELNGTSSGPGHS